MDSPPKNARNAILAALLCHCCPPRHVRNKLISSKGRQWFPPSKRHKPSSKPPPLLWPSTKVGWSTSQGQAQASDRCSAWWVPNVCCNTNLPWIMTVVQRTFAKPHNWGRESALLSGTESALCRSYSAGFQQTLASSWSSLQCHSSSCACPWYPDWSFPYCTSCECGMGRFCTNPLVIASRVWEEI